MKIVLNGEKTNVTDGFFVAELLLEKKIASPLVIVEINKNVIDKESFSGHKINEGDIIEVIQLMGGG